MGAAGSHLTRNFRRFNVINRTERIISKEKPTAAPLHKVDAERLKHLLKNNPEVREELLNKDSTLEQNLKTVYVKSEGDLPDVYPQSKVKLPTNREQVFTSGFSVEEPEYIPPGRYTLTQITECIADHYKDKQMYTVKVLADRIGIDEKLMENILKHYRIFDMYIPQKMMEKQTSKNQLFLSNAIDKIRKTLDVDKYTHEHKQIDKKYADEQKYIGKN